MPSRENRLNQRTLSSFFFYFHVVGFGAGSQSLKILKESDLMPFVVFIAPPSLEKLRAKKREKSEPFKVALRNRIFLCFLLRFSIALLRLVVPFPSLYREELVRDLVPPSFT